MEGYNIDKIKFKSDKTPSIEEKLTGKVITGLEKHEDVKPNAELEGKEYIQFPDGTTQLVAGESHGKGGVKMFIPDGTRIVSNSLNPSKKQIKFIKENYDLNVSTKDSYANVINKYVKKIGLEKLYKEEEDILGLLKKQVEDETMDVSTSNVNREYISGKLSEIEQEKKAKELDKTEFFGSIFEMQELSKPENKKVMADQGKMKFGGLSNNEFKALCEKHGLSEDVARDLLQGNMPKFEGGGEKGTIEDELKLLDPTGKYRTIEALGEAYKNKEISGETYDRLELLIGNLEARGGNPETEAVYTIGDTAAGTGKRVKEPYSEKEAFGPEGLKRLNDFIKTHRGEEYKLKEGATKAEMEKAAGELQKHMGKEYTDLVYDYMVNKSHQPNYKLREKLPEGYEPTNEGVKKAIEDGKLKKEDVVDAYKDDKWWYRALDVREVPLPRDEYEKAIKREGAIKQGDNLYFNEDPNEPEVYTKYVPIDKETKEGTEKKEPEEGTGEKQISTDVRLPRKEYPRLFGAPNQIPLPPSGMQGQLMGETRLQRMDPIKIGIEPQMQEAGVQREFAAKQYFGNLAPNVAASVFANTLGAQTKSINEAARIAHVTNAQNAANTELFNIGQAGQEQEANLRNKMSFEQRQYTAQAKTEEELRNWLDQVRKVHVTNYKNNQQLNLMNQMFPNANLNSAGNQIDYDPNYQWKIDQTGRRYRMLYGEQAVKT